MTPEKNVNLFCKTDGDPAMFVVYADNQRKKQCISQLIHMFGGEIISVEERIKADYVIVEPGTTSLDGIDVFSEDQVVGSQFIWSSIDASKMLPTEKFRIHRKPVQKQSMATSAADETRPQGTISEVFGENVDIGDSDQGAYLSLIDLPRTDWGATEDSVLVNQQAQGTFFSELEDVLDMSISMKTLADTNSLKKDFSRTLALDNNTRSEMQAGGVVSISTADVLSAEAMSPEQVAYNVANEADGYTHLDNTHL